MLPTALLFVVCQAAAVQGPPDVNGFPAEGIKLDLSTCRNELVEMADSTALAGVPSLPDFSNPNVCSRMAMSETPHWQDDHPGWYVLRVKCPHPDGTFPKDTNV
jgi:hypothetical protein